jgi:hypothetical protein
VVGAGGLGGPPVGGLKDAFPGGFPGGFPVGGAYVPGFFQGAPFILCSYILFDVVIDDKY